MDGTVEGLRSSKQMIQLLHSRRVLSDLPHFPAANNQHISTNYPEVKIQQYIKGQIENTQNTGAFCVTKDCTYPNHHSSIR